MISSNSPSQLRGVPTLKQKNGQNEDCYRFLAVQVNNVSTFDKMWSDKLLHRVYHEAIQSPPSYADMEIFMAKAVAANKATTKAATKPAKPTAMPNGLDVGKKAPAFALPADDGSTVKMKDLKGKKIVLYFYPKDMTPGCTTEAIDFSAKKKAFEKAGAEVFGISKDSTERHLKFRDKHDLTIGLLSDEDGEMLEAYGVWAEKSLYGRKFMGINRTTFLIDEKGVIVRIWQKVKVKDHAEDVLDAVKAL